jgi:hypothetical protein
MSEAHPVQLPRFGQTSQDDLAVALDGGGGNTGGGIYVGVRASPLPHRSSDAVSHLRPDGQNSTRLLLGFSALCNRVMSNLRSGNTIVSRETGRDRGISLQLVPAVQQLSTGPGVASRGDGVGVSDSDGFVDAVSDKAHTLMPFSLIIKLAPLAGIAAGFFSFIEGSRAVDILLSIVGSSAFIGLLGAIKYLVDRRDKTRAQLLLMGRTDAQIDLEREKLVDTQFVALFKQWEEFYGFREREKMAVIELLKATVQQKDDLINQQRELITKQAQQLQQVQSK